MLSLKNIYLISHELLFPTPSNIYTDLPPSRLFWMPPCCPCLSWLGGVGVVLLYPSCTPISAVITFLLTCPANADPDNTTSSTITGCVTVRVLPLKAVITPQVPTLLASVGSPSTVSIEILFNFSVQARLAMAYKSDEVISCIDPQRRM